MSAPSLMKFSVVVLPAPVSVKSADEGTGLVGLVPAQDLDVGAVLFVVVGDAVGEAVHEDGHGGDVDAAVGGNLAGLRRAGSYVAGQECSLGRVVDDRLDVIQVNRLVIDDGEVALRVGLGHFLRGVGQEEADGDSDVAAVLDNHGVQVRAEVGLRLGLGGLHLDAQVSFGSLQAFEAGLVERAVIESAGVRNHAGQEVAVGACLAAGCGVFFRGGTAAGQQKRRCAQHGDGYTGIALEAAREILQCSSRKEKCSTALAASWPAGREGLRRCVWCALLPSWSAARPNHSACVPQH